MYNMKKIAALGMAGALLVLGCVGCGNNAAGGENNAVSASGVETGSDEVYTLKVQSHDPETSATGQFLNEWTEAMEEASGGRLQFDVFHGGSLGAGTESFNMVTSGAVDIAWGLPSFTTGKFPLTDVVSLPFLADNSVQASYALWDLYESTDYLDEEWSEVKVLLLHTNCDSPLLLKKNKIESGTDLAGQSIRFLGGPSTEFGEALGANPVAMPISDVYTSLEKGVVSGAANCGWDAISAFKLYEQADYICDWHYNVNPYYLVMNKDSYAKLPEDLQAIIDEYSGYKALEYAGNKWQDTKEETMKACEDKIYTLSDSEQAAVEAIGEEVSKQWIADISESGVDGQGLFDAYVERVEKYADKADQ